MKIDNNNFTLQELEMIYNSNPIMGDIDSLNEYSSAPYFNIKKFYKDETLVGYAIIFLGYNGIESNDASIEDIAYFNNDINDLKEFLKLVKNAQDYTFFINNFYFISNNIDSRICPILEELGFMESSRRR